MDELIGHFEILNLVAEGSRGKVFVAQGELDDEQVKLVAIKQFSASGNSRALQQALEAQRLLNVSDGWEAHEFLANERAFVMQYVHGLSLDKIVARLQERKETFFADALAALDAK